ncbi:protein kinase [Gracilaria domingensis]|nr:protein kinase [Gracilaria domingensis]
MLGITGGEKIISGRQTIAPLALDPEGHGEQLPPAAPVCTCPGGHGVQDLAKLTLAPARKVPGGHGEQPCSLLKKNPSLQKQVVRAGLGNEFAEHCLHSVKKLTFGPSRN